MSHIKTIILKEIVEREFERYGLEQMGFPVNRDIMTEWLMKHDNTLIEQLTSKEFNTWKENLLQLFYVNHNFAGYFSKNLQQQSLIIQIRGLMRRVLKIMNIKQKDSTIDHQLRLGNKYTLAYKLSSEYFKVILPDMKLQTSIWASPIVFEGYCSSFLKQYYPINYITLIERLEKNDNEFWEGMARLIRYIARAELSRSTYIDKDYVVEELSSEALITFKRLLSTHRLNHIMDASHLYYSIKKIIRYKRLEYDKTLKFDDAMENEDWIVNGEDYDASNLDYLDKNSSFLYLLDINPNNKTHLWHSIAKTLSESQGEVYCDLIRGNEVYVEIFKMFYFEGLSYKEIAKQYNNAYSEVNLRKIVSRTRTTLEQRMYGLISCYQKRTYV